MKQFSCGAVVPGCMATFEADTEDELMAKVADHARDDHGMDTVPPELGAQIRSLIVTTD